MSPTDRLYLAQDDFGRIDAVDGLHEFAEGCILALRVTARTAQQADADVQSVAAAQGLECDLSEAVFYRYGFRKRFDDVPLRQMQRKRIGIAIPLVDPQVVPAFGRKAAGPERSGATGTNRREPVLLA